MIYVIEITYPIKSISLTSVFVGVVAQAAVFHSVAPQRFGDAKIGGFAEELVMAALGICKHNKK